MKVLVYSRPGRGLSVFFPSQGHRLASQLQVGQAVVLADPPVAAEKFFGRWPVAGAEPAWAETEEAFIDRILSRVVPADAVGVRVIEDSELPSNRASRSQWRDTGTAIVVEDGG